MSASNPRRWSRAIAAGFAGGLLALLVLRWDVPGLSEAVYVLSYPGIRLGRVWTDSGLPPHGDAAFGIIALGILIQWTAVGALVGWWRGRRGK